MKNKNYFRNTPESFSQPRKNFRKRSGLNKKYSNVKKK
jgi:hypothetical protein